MEFQPNFERFIKDNQEQVLLVGALEIQKTVLEIMEEELSSSLKDISSSGDISGAIKGIHTSSDLFRMQMENSNERLTLVFTLADELLKENRGV